MRELILLEKFKNCFPEQIVLFITKSAIGDKSSCLAEFILTCKTVFMTLVILGLNVAKVFIGMSCHSAAILVMLPGSSFGLTRPGLYLSEWEDSQNCTFPFHWDIKTACRKSTGKSDKKKSLKKLDNFAP